MIGKLAEKDKDDQQDSNIIYWFIGLMSLMVILQATSSCIGYIVIFTASRKLHNKMVWSLLRTKLEFFDSNTVGTILTKFTKDIAGLDEFIPLMSFLTMRFLTTNLASIIVVIVAAPFMIIIIIIAFILMYIARRSNYLPAQILEWVESECRGPINTKFSSLIDGLMTIRAYNKQEFFQHNYFIDSDRVSSVALSRYGVTNWYLQSLDFISYFIVFFTVILVFILKLYTDWVDEVFLAIAITTSSTLVGNISTVGTLYSELENQMKLVKNAIAYADLEPEGDLEHSNDPSDWPTQGSIEFIDVTMKYKDALKPVLDQASFSIPGCHKIGIKGRTGAGKSSVISTLYRMYDISNGQIMIDGQDIHQMGLHCLRSHVSYIPQVPFLMSGTVIHNIDPFNRYTQDEVIQALVDVQLWEYVNSLKDGIQTEISESSVLFSLGQKQLI